MVKQGYKQTEIGVIPEDWEVRELGEFCFITKLAGFEYSKYFNSYKDGGDVIVVRGTNITNNKLDLSDVKYIPRKISDFLYRSKLSKGDLVFAYVGTIGPIYLINEDNRFHLGPNTAKIRIEDNNISTSYIYSYFLSENIKKEIDDRISIGAQPSLSMTKIRDFSIILPPLPEQEAIAEALSDADAWIESLEQLIAKKRLIKQGAMQTLLTPKEDWEVKKFEDIFIRIASKKYQINSSEYFELGKYPIVDQGQQKIVGYSERDDKVFDLQNIIIFGDHTRIIKYVDYPFIVGADGVQILSSIKDDIKFLYYLLNVYEIPNTGYNRHFKYLKDFDYCIPSLSEQQRIATILSDMDAEIEALEQKLSKARQIKQGMMQELLTGRVRLVS